MKAKTLVTLFGIILIVLGIGYITVGIINPDYEMARTVEVECYDQRHNIMLDQTCLDVLSTKSESLVFMGVSFLFFGILGVTAFRIMLDEGGYL